MSEEKRPVYVVGHKNPDTDSICSAISYSRLKSRTSDGEYEPRRAGELNQETRFVLEHLGVEIPRLITDVRTQVRDIEIRKMDGVSKELSLKKAWQLMKGAGVVTLPITSDGELEGVISMGDIISSYMDVYDTGILSMAHTSYHNIVETLDGTMIVGNIEDTADKGKVVIAAGSPEMMESYIGEGDVVILGNRYENQLCAIELSASCIIVCGNATVANTIQKFAADHKCKIICTPHDTYTVARLINQSMPISYFMKGKDLVVFHLDDYIDDIKQVMASLRHRYFPILDENGKYAGMLSRRNFLGARKKQVILVDHNEKNQAVNGVESSQILEIIDHHRLQTVETMNPVFFRNQPLGCTCTIVYQMYKEQGVTIDPNTAGLMLSAIISDTLLFRSPTCTLTDKAAAMSLAEIAGIQPEEYAQEMFRAGSNLGGKTPDEIIHQDFKRFELGSKSIAIGQITSMSESEIAEIRQKVQPELENELSHSKLDMVFFMFTNIMKESTIVSFAGKDSLSVMETAFNTQADEDGSFNLKGVVSRKKQMLPALVEAIER